MGGLLGRPFVLISQFKDVETPTTRRTDHASSVLASSP
jgi:hypothetical protein